MQLFFMLLPIVASLIILIYALKKGFDRTAFYIAAATAMVIAMFIVLSYLPLPVMAGGQTKKKQIE